MWLLHDNSASDIPVLCCTKCNESKEKRESILYKKRRLDVYVLRLQQLCYENSLLPVQEEKNNMILRFQVKTFNLSLYFILDTGVLLHVCENVDFVTFNDASVFIEHVQILSYLIIYWWLCYALTHFYHNLNQGGVCKSIGIYVITYFMFGFLYV